MPYKLITNHYTPHFSFCQGIFGEFDILRKSALTSKNPQFGITSCFMFISANISAKSDFLRFFKKIFVFFFFFY